MGLRFCVGPSALGLVVVVDLGLPAVGLGYYVVAPLALSVAVMPWCMVPVIDLGCWLPVIDLGCMMPVIDVGCWLPVLGGGWIGAF